MSKFFTEKYDNIVPYVPGEQPRDKKYIKLNTNESPYAPSYPVLQAVFQEAKRLNLYSDMECTDLRAQMSESFGLPAEYILMTNGSDEGLNLAFMAFADEKRPLVFPDITYGFYPIIAGLNHIPYTEIPLTEDFSINTEDYIGINKTVVIANPNAPTGKFLPVSEIEKIVASNPDNIVIVDEAYIDFGGESAKDLVFRYDNVLIIGTFSKSRSMAGARLGYVFGNPELISDMNTLKYASNPYNVNLLTSAAGIAALKTQEYYDENCRVIIENRKWTVNKLEELGFCVIPSTANFVFASSDRIGGEELYLSLKAKGVLVRHFSKERIKDYCRITIGTIEQMQILIDKVTEILEEMSK